MIRKPPLPSLALCASLVGAAAAQDLTIVSKLVGLRGSVTTREHISGSKVRTSQGDYDAIYDTASGRVVQIDNSAKEYYETSAAEIEARSVAIRKRTQQPERAPAEPVTVSKGPIPTSVAGIPCDTYTLESGGLTLEVCLAAVVAPAHAEAQRLALLRGSGDPALQALYAQLRALGGLPLTEQRTGRTGEREIRSRREVLELKTGPLPAATFELPTGYKKKDSPYKFVPKLPAPPQS